jgi:hypothetical protein
MSNSAPQQDERLRRPAGLRSLRLGETKVTYVPDWSAHPDHDRVQSAVSRRQLVAALQEPDTIGFGIHFADVVFGRVRRDGADAVWEPVDG